MVLYSESNPTTLEGRTIAITGANTGIGRGTAMDLSKRGAKILMLCRNEEKTKPVMEEIAEASGNEVVFYPLDLASLKSVRECAEAIIANEEKLDILINNAGIMICPNWKTEDGFEMQFGTNHLGHFLLTELLLPLLKQSAESGFHPSKAHEYGEIHWDDINLEKGYNEIKAYNQSKLANVMHAKELARRLEGTGITTYSLHPGIVNTELQRHGRDKWYGCFLAMGQPFLKSPLQGCQTTLYCVLEESIQDDSGKYYAGCREKQPQHRALVEEDQKRLWKLSEEMVGLTGENE